MDYCKLGDCDTYYVNAQLNSGWSGMVDGGICNKYQLSFPKMHAWNRSMTSMHAYDVWWASFITPLFLFVPSINQNLTLKRSSTLVIPWSLALIYISRKPRRLIMRDLKVRWRRRIRHVLTKPRSPRGWHSLTWLLASCCKCKRILIC